MVGAPPSILPATRGAGRLIGREKKTVFFSGFIFDAQ
jgi:hypothetical protein